MTTASKRLPIDSGEFDGDLTDEDWERSQRTHERLMGFVQASPEAQARYDDLLAEIDQRQATLRRVREAWALTQTTIAELLEMDQSEVSRLERRSDVLLSTLRRFISAAGGDLRLIVSFPEMAPVELRLDLSPADEPGPEHLSPAASGRRRRSVKEGARSRPSKSVTAGKKRSNQPGSSKSAKSATVGARSSSTTGKK